MEIKLPYRLRNNQLVTIDEVDNGLDCNCVCVCPACKQPQIARKSQKYIHISLHHHLKAPRLTPQILWICVPT